MSDDFETIDESGDILIILTPSTEPFAPWEETDDENDPKDGEYDEYEDIGEDELKLEIEEVRLELEDLKVEDAMHQKQSAGAEETDATQTIACVSLEDAQDEPEEEVDEEQEDTNPVPNEFRAVVSSAILRRASPVFRKDLGPNGPWRQLEIQSDGLRHKHIDGFDPGALMHVLNLIHLRNSRVPRFLAVEDLAKVATVVDYLQCREAIALATKMWIDETIQLPKEQLDRPLVLWLLISTVFSVKPIFQQAASIIIMHGSEPFDTLGLPIKGNVVHVLDKTRQDRITWFLDALYELREDLLHGSGCTAECDTWHLGTLEKCLWRGNLSPRPQEPFEGISVSGVYQVLTNFKEAVRGVVWDKCHVDNPTCVLVTESWLGDLEELIREPLRSELK